MEINDMKYTLQLEVDKRVEERLREKKGLRKLEMMFWIIGAFMVGFILAKIQW